MSPKMTATNSTCTAADLPDELIRQRVQMVVHILGHGSKSNRREMLAAIAIAVSELIRLAAGDPQ